MDLINFRYDYENCDSACADKMMHSIEALIQKPEFIGKKLQYEDKEYIIKQADNYSYTDPVDNSKATKQVYPIYNFVDISHLHINNVHICHIFTWQGLRILFEDGSRIIFRLSGTGSSGATIRMYIDSYENDPSTFQKDAQLILKPLINIALKLSELCQYTGRDAPTVIT